MKKLYTTFIFSLMVSLVAFGQPTNDNCADAIAIGDTTGMAFTNIDATTDGPYHLDSPCPSNSEEGQDSVYNDIWYLYTPTYTGNAQWSLCGTADFDTKIAVYNAGAVCPLQDGDLLTCNEDGAGCDNSTSDLIFQVEAGSTYLLRLGGYGLTTPGEEGSGTFSLGEFVSSVPNDLCTDAATISLGSGQNFDITGTITDGPDHPGNNTCFGFNFITASNDIWYNYTADFTGSVIWSTCNSINFDSRLAVYGPDATCPVQDGDLYACNDDGAGCSNFTSRLFFDVEEGKTYLLRLGSFNGEQGFGTFDLLNENPPEPPSNDLCENPDEIILSEADDVQELLGTTINATFDDATFLFPSCLTNTTGGEFTDVYYRFNTGGFSAIEVTMASFTSDAMYIIDVLPDCSNPLDTTLLTNGACFFMDAAATGGLVADTIETLPDTPQDFILRVSTRVTTDAPGDFAIWMIGLGTTSVEDDAFFGNTTFGPNPLSGNRGTLTTHLQKATDLNLTVTDVAGKVVSSQFLPNLKTGKNLINVDFPTDEKGIYFVTLRSESLMKSLKVIRI